MYNLVAPFIGDHALIGALINCLWLLGFVTFEMFSDIISHDGAYFPEWIISVRTTAIEVLCCLLVSSDRHPEFDRNLVKFVVR
jgi:hypothetical protein